MTDSRSDSPLPLFETALDRVISRLSFPADELLRPLAGQPLVDRQSLASEIREYLIQLDESLATHEFLDLETAKAVARVCERLVEVLPENASTEQQQLLQVAVRYFIEDEDAEGDLSSPIGFDDDLEVAKEIARELGLEDSVKSVGEGK